ncbi:MAG: tRNA (adenosine(37)-N6)-threonylcarbamoyltransferase complex transferase subunit TsaD [Myxococcota bacterium]
MALILGIESSCDDLAAAVVRDGREVLASVVHGQDAVHAPYGGVVPELASRDHIRHVWQTVEHALERAGLTPEDVDGIGVTSGPGLIGSLLVGLCFAKALAHRTGKPLLGVHHIEGHLASARLGERPLELPYLGLVVSGGHTALYRVQTLARIELLGQTRDDAAGEAFDKVAKRLGLGYPGGREIDRIARGGNPRAFAFPRPMLREPGLEMSFSGLKTAVALEVARLEREADPRSRESLKEDLAASFQEAAIDVLVTKTRRALEETGLRRLAVVGGLAASSRLRERMAELCDERGVELHFPPPQLCTDNAAMIAAVADRMLEEGRVAAPDLEAFSRVPLPQPATAADATPPVQGGAPGGSGSTLVRERLAEHGLVPSRARGQNFLRSPAMAERIVECCGLTPQDAVIEVGPGLGDLTRAIARVARRVLAIELDHGLVGLLRGSPLPAHVEVRPGDILRVDLPALVRELAPPVVLLGNLPYRIAGRLLARLCRPACPFRRLGLMIQAEVADRVLARPGTPCYGTLSVWARLWMRAERVLTLGPAEFVPRPKVTSAWVVLEPREGPEIRDLALLERVVRAAFQQRRKTLRAALRRSVPGAEQGLLTAGVDPGRRGETLTEQEFVRLANAIDSEEHES